MAVNYRTDVLDVLAEMLGTIPGVKQGKAFGMPGYSVGGKLFASVYEDGVAVKVPKEKVAEVMGQPQIAPFQPFGKMVMKEWVLIRHEDPQAYKQEAALFDIAIQFVASQVK